MSKSFSKRLSLTVVVLLLVVVLALGVAIVGKGFTKKRGIVIVTALLSGGLYLNNEDGTQTPIWDPLLNYEDFPVQDVLSPDGMNISMDVINEALKGLGGLSGVFELIDANKGLLPTLMVDIMTGESVYDIVPATPESPTRLKYGAINCYEETYNEMVARYGEQAEVVVFNYDWRLDNKRNGELLEEFINERGYDEVILTSHSMGGSVVSCYLDKEVNRKKVLLYTPYSCAALGSLDALVFIEDIGRLLSGFDLSAVESFVDVNQLVENIGGPFLRSMVSMYQIFPSPALMTSEQYSGEGSYMITVDGKPIETREELIEFYKSRPFAKVDGECIYPFQVEENGLTRLENYWDAQFTDGVHNTNLVNTVYFIGTGQSGVEGVSYVTNEKGEIVLDTTRKSTNGDNVILHYAATCGNPIDAENVVLIENAHINVGVNFNVLLKERTFEEIDKVLK